MNQSNTCFTYCPRCGQQALNTDDDHLFLCASCDLHLFMNTAAAVAVVMKDARGRILMTRRASDPAAGKLDLPGGFVNHGETAEECAHREVCEELRLELNGLTYLFTSSNEYLYKDVFYRTMDVVFYADVASWDTLSAEDDIADYEFLALSDVPMDEVAFISIRTILGRLREISPRR